MRIYIVFSIRLLVGIFFLFSAYSKLFPIEPFELTILHYKLMPWGMVPYFSRLLIGVEALIGVLLIVGWHKNIVYYFTGFLLIIFTIFISYTYFLEGNQADCGCMGDMIKLNPLESVAKNILLIVLLWILYKYDQYGLHWYKTVLSLLLLIGVLMLPFIFNPPDSYISLFAEKPKQNYALDTTIFDTTRINGNKINLYKGDYILAVLNLHCAHCKTAAGKLELIKRDIGDKLPPIYFILVGFQEDVPYFFEESKSNFPYGILREPKRVMKLTSGTFPLIFYVSDGVVKHTFTNYELTPDELLKYSQNSYYSNSPNE